MLSLEICKKILSSQDRKYSDDEIKTIMNVLEQLAYFEYTSHKSKKVKNGSGNYLHKGKHRRTG